MNKSTSHNNTREHLLTTGEQLCVIRGFTGMGLTELLSEAGVPKGSFYYHFRSKEAFGVALLERYYTQQYQLFSQLLVDDDISPRQRLINHFHQSLANFEQNGHIAGCLGVKLSAEVCDLSEEMRQALQQGTQQLVAVYRDVLQLSLAAGEIRLPHGTSETAQLLWLLWLGASLQSKISRRSEALRLALACIERWLTH